MRFGLFGSAEAGGDAAGTSRGQGFRNYIEYNVEAEALGYHSSFIVEHHFSGWSQVSATLQLLNWVAARTTTLRVGTAVMVLPWHNPVLLAEQAATLDVLSGGRLDLGVGKGYRHNEFKGFGIPIEEADARFEEALAILAKAWTSPKWSNPESQNSGKIALVRKFTRNGQQCETLDYRTKRRPVGPQHYRLSSCLRRDGQWRLI